MVLVAGQNPSLKLLRVIASQFVDGQGISDFIVLFSSEDSQVTAVSRNATVSG